MIGAKISFLLNKTLKSINMTIYTEKKNYRHEVKYSTPLIAIEGIASSTILEVKVQLFQSCPNYKH